ncbi:MAG TPA: O-antigen ligase family protein [Blastocatellia bacterium]|nr:O-antigen ligase family protein [Blastocatellia bacterium]
MNVMNNRLARIAPGHGVLFKRRAINESRIIAGAASPLAVAGLTARPGAVSRTDSVGKHRLAFAGIFLFTLLLYTRPQEIIPGLFGWLPLPKIVAISSVLIYIASRLSAGERLIIWSTEMKMITLLWALGLLFAPIAVSPGDSFNVLFDPLIKILIVFAMQIALVDTRSRFRAMMGIMVFCQALYSLHSIRTYLTGGYSEIASFQSRISGWGENLKNPNDIACVLALMAPLSVICALLQRGWKRWLFFASAGVTAVAILFTYSRSGFLALIASSGLLIWKASRGRRIQTLIPVVVLAAALFATAPGKYMSRLSTIFNPENDPTNSAQERRGQLIRAAEVAIRRPIIGVGMGNYHIYAIKEMRAHNAYLETAAELGAVGLIAFLVIIFAPLRSLRRIERETAPDGPRPDHGKHIVSVCLQASFVAFLIYGFFGSMQYDSYLYTLVALAVSLRRIHSQESQVAADHGAESPESKAMAPARESFWPSRESQERRLNGVLWGSR